MPTDRENWWDEDFADRIDPKEDFSEEDNHVAAGRMAVAGRSPKHPRTESDDDSALLDRAADRFSACMDTKVDSMMDRLERRMNERIDSKLGPVMDILSALEKQSAAAQEVVLLQCLTMVDLQDKVVLLTWKPRVRCGFRDRNTKAATRIWS